MKKKFDLSAYFAKNWFYYLVWLIFAIFAWESIFALVTKPKKEECVYLFFGVENTKTELLETDLKIAKPEYVRFLDITSYSTRDDGFETLLYTRGQTQADIYILPQSFCEPAAMQALFYPMDVSEVNEIFGDAEFEEATIDGKVYGVKVYDAENNVGRASDYFTYTYIGADGSDTAVGDYYLFFSKKSVHLGDLTGSERNGAIVLAQFIFDQRAES